MSGLSTVHSAKMTVLCELITRWKKCRAPTPLDLLETPWRGLNRKQVHECGHVYEIQAVCVHVSRRLRSRTDARPAGPQGEV